MTDRSEWHTPVAPIFTRSSPALGGSSFRSSTAYWFSSRVTSPFISIPPARRVGGRVRAPLYGFRPRRLKPAPALVDSDYQNPLECVAMHRWLAPLTVLLTLAA